MPQRFHTTSTNRIIQLTQPSANAELDDMLEINRQIQRLIENFNLGVEGSFTAGGMQGLKNFCTPAGLARMQEKYTGWKKQSIAALNLVSCDFLSFDLNTEKDLAHVFTFEKWVFVREDGTETYTEGSVDGYEMHFSDGRWLVDSVKFYAPE